MFLTSVVMLVFKTPAQIVTTMIASSKNGVTMCIEFLGIYALWLGILQILDDTKLSLKLSNLLKKPVKFLFGEQSEETTKNICLNITSNIIGLGSAATPFGIKAMQGMQSGEVATRSMIMLVVINSTGIQFLPTTVIGLRALAGSISPSSILIPTIISTFLPTILGIILVMLIYRNKPTNNKKIEKENKNTEKTPKISSFLINKSKIYKSFKKFKSKVKRNYV